MKVKKGDTLAVIEHNDLKAMLASREAQTLRTAAELEEARADLWEKEREDRRVSRLFAQRSVTPEESEKALSGHKKAAARVTALEAAVKLMKANVEEIKATIVTHASLRPVRRHGRRKAGRGRRGHLADGDELLAGPNGRGDHRQPRENGRRDQDPREHCSGGSHWVSRPRFPSARFHPSATEAGFAR